MNTATEHAFERRVEEILLRQGGWRRVANAEWEAERALFPARICAFLEATQPKLWAQMRALHADGLESLLVDTLARELDLKGTLHVLRHGFKFYGKTFRMAWFKPAHALNEEVLALYGKNKLTITRQAPCHPKKLDTVDLLFALNGLPVATCELKNPGTGQSWRHAVRQYRNDRDPRAPLFRFKARALVHFAADPNEVHMSTRIGGAESRFLPFNRGSHPGEVRCGAGNPRHPSGYRTGYFWEEVLERDSFLDVLGHFMFIETKDEKVDDGKGGVRRITRETLIFPRYHQLDAVRKLIAAAREEGSGRNYLIQHSAGSGKTNSISWLSHRLASLHDREDRKVFDCVVVITDRRVLDRQLQDAIYQIEHAQGVVKAIDRDSRQLAAALIDDTRIVVTTLQKFPFVLRGLLHAAGAESQEAATAGEKARAKAWEAEIAKRRYAVIVDEAHSSQTGETARELKAILGAGANLGVDEGLDPGTDLGADGDTDPSANEGAGKGLDPSTNGGVGPGMDLGADEGADLSAHPGTNEDAEDEQDWEDRLNQIMASRGRQPNLSFFAFTATPKGKTLELFGRSDGRSRPGERHSGESRSGESRSDERGTPEAFHLYSMRQAIEEGFILDVLASYTTYAAYYGLLKNVEDDPKLPRKKAARALAKFASPASAQRRAEDRGDRRALPPRRDAPDRRTREGDGGHPFAAARGALQALLRALPGRERLYRRSSAGRVQRHGARPRHRHRIYGARHERGRRDRQAHRRRGVARSFRFTGLPSAAGRQQVPDRFRPAAPVCDVRGQAAGRGPGGADALAAEPDDPRQGGAVRARLRERRGGRPAGLQALLRRDGDGGGVQARETGGVEARARPDPDLPLERGRGVRPDLLQAFGTPERRGFTRTCSATSSRRWIASRASRKTTSARSSGRSSRAS